MPKGYNKKYCLAFLQTLYNTLLFFTSKKPWWKQYLKFKRTKDLKDFFLQKDGIYVLI